MMRLSLSSDFFRTGAADDDLLPVNQKRKFFGLFYIFTGFSSTPSNLFQQLIDCWRIEIQMEPIWISDEPSREPFLSVWTSLKNSFFSESICVTRHTEKENSRVRRIPLEHYHTWMNHEIKMMNLNCNELLWEKLFFLSSTTAVYLIH